MPSSRYAVNCSILFSDLPFSERFARAKDAGYRAVELWWPFSSPDPSRDEVSDLVRSLRQADVELVGMNLFAGDMPGGDRGVVSLPDRSEEVLAGLDAVREVARETGCGVFNALYGRSGVDLPDDAGRAPAVSVLATAATSLEDVGTVVIEALSGAEDYPLKSSDQAMAVVEQTRQAGASNVGLLLDVYHLAVNGDDPARAISRFAADIVHMQLADAPGRGAPGTADLPLEQWVEQLLAQGYSGHIGLEYSSQDSDPLAAAQLPRIHTDRKD